MPRALSLLTIVSFLLVSAAFALAEAPTSSPSPAPAQKVPTLQEILDERTGDFPGSGIVLARIGPNGVVVSTSGSSGTARPLDRSSLFEIGSVTKTFTATILASMVLDGSVKLDDPIARYLPKTVHVPERNGKKITLLDLADQRSGLPRLPTNLKDLRTDDPYAHYTAADMYAFLSEYKLTRGPGDESEYSNYGIGLLGQVLANRAHVSYADLLRTRVLTPLGMDDATLSITADQATRFAAGRSADNDPVHPWTFDAIAPAGALHASIDDMVKFARCNMGEGPLAKACLFAQKPREFFPGNRIGLVWLMGQKDRIVHHGGDTAGFHAAVAISPDHTMATIALENGGLPIEDIALHTLDPSVPVARIPRAIALDARTLDAYVGTYVCTAPALTFLVTHEGDTLEVQLSGQEKSRIYPDGTDTFVSHIVAARFKFVRDDAGNPVALVLGQSGQTIAFVRPGAAAPPDSVLSPYPPIVDLGDETLRSYVGTYMSSIGMFTVARNHSQLFVLLEGQKSLAVFASAKDAFFYKDVAARIEFGRDASGNVNTLTLHQGGAVIVATKK